MINKNAIKTIESGCTAFNNAKKSLFDAASDLAVAYCDNGSAVDTDHLSGLVLEKIKHTEESLDYFKRCIKDCRL